MLEWNGDSALVVDGTDFALAPSNIAGARAATDAGALLLRKGRWMVERYAELRADLAPTNIFELGIYDGGSTALLALLFQPRRLVAIDLKAERAPALDRFLDANGLAGSVHAYYGVDQSDRPRLEQILEDEFGDVPLDLVIDDASHLLHQTIASFNLLFPRLRPGGAFVIEDWSWQHFRDEAIEAKLRSDPKALAAIARQLEAGGPAGPPDHPLSRLVLQVVLTAAYDEGVVAEITGLRRGWALVRRGDATLDPDGFDITQCYGSLGNALLRDGS